MSDPCISVPVSTVARLINQPLIRPSVADNLARIVADCRAEERRNAEAERHNRTAKTEDLIPYSNRAYLNLVDHVDRLCQQVRGE